jgi:hypothetical protein
VAWLPRRRILFAGDLVEAKAALYTGDAFHADWAGGVDRVAAFGAEILVGGRGAVPRGREAVRAAIEQTGNVLREMQRAVGSARAGGGTLKDAFAAAHAALAPRYGHWPIFEHCMPFDVSRSWDELDGIDWPRIWTAERGAGAELGHGGCGERGVEARGGAARRRRRSWRPTTGSGMRPGSRTSR